MHKRRHKNVMHIHMQRIDLRSNILEVALFGKKLKQRLLVTDRARTLLPHTQITRVHAPPFLSKITCLNSSWAGSLGEFCTQPPRGDLIPILFQLGAGWA